MLIQTTKVEDRIPERIAKEVIEEFDLLFEGSGELYGIAKPYENGKVLAIGAIEVCKTIGHGIIGMFTQVRFDNPNAKEIPFTELMVEKMEDGGTNDKPIDKLDVLLWKIKLDYKFEPYVITLNPYMVEDYFKMDEYLSNYRFEPRYVYRLMADVYEAYNPTISNLPKDCIYNLQVSKVDLDYTPDMETVDIIDHQIFDD